MTQKIIVATLKNQYLGLISLDTANHFKIEAENKNNKKILAGIIQDTTSKEVNITECRYEGKDGKSSHILYLRKVSPKDGPLYLEGIKEALRAKNLKAYLLEEDKAKLLALTYQSKIPEQIKQAISTYLQDIPENKTKELIKLFQEEKEGLERIEQEFKNK